MSNITEKDILKLKNDALTIRDQVISAKSTYDNILKNIESYQEELKQLGVDKNVDEKIEEMRNEIAEIYNEALEQIKEWKLKMV